MILRGLENRQYEREDMLKRIDGFKLVGMEKFLEYNPET